jgi:hypothetical protein
VTFHIPRPITYYVMGYRREFVTEMTGVFL